MDAINTIEAEQLQPIRMNETFTAEARQVFLLAKQEAARFNHEYIGTEHVLLGLVSNDISVASRVLAHLQVNQSRIRSEVERLIQSGRYPVPRELLPQTPRMKKVVEFAMDEARRMNRRAVGSEHLLLGLIREDEGVAAEVLTNLGLTLDRIREEVIVVSARATESCEPNDSFESRSIAASQHDITQRPNRSIESALQKRFTDRARKILQLANQEAQRFNQEYVGTEHLLLGLVKEGNGVAAYALKNLDIDLRTIRMESEKLVQTGPDLVTMGRLPRTPRAKKVLEYAMDEAHSMNHDYVGGEHILLGLLREQEGVAAQILMNLGMKLDDVRREVLNIVGQGTEPSETSPLGPLEPKEHRISAAGVHIGIRAAIIAVILLCLWSWWWWGR